MPRNEEVDAGDEGDDDDEGGESLGGLAHEELGIDRIQGVGARQNDGADTQRGRDPKRDDGKGEDAVERQGEEIRKAVLALAGMTHGPLHRDPGLGESGPAPQPPKIAVMLGRAPKLVDHPPGHQGEIPGVQRQLQAGHARHDPVEEVVRQTQPPRLLPPFALGVDHVVTLPMLLQQARNFLGPVLEIPVHDHCHVSGDVVNSGCQGPLVTEVPGDVDGDDPRILRRRFVQQLGSSVRASAVHKDHLVGPAPDPIEDGSKTPEELRKGILLISRREPSRKAERNRP